MVQYVGKLMTTSFKYGEKKVNYTCNPSLKETSNLIKYNT